MPDPGTVSPALDDAYWFTYSKDIVEKAVTSRNEQAGRFQTFIVWLWGIYTASAAVGLTLGSKNFPWYSTVLIALPSVILILAYWSTVYAQTPPYVGFDPRSPTEIMAAYDLGVREKEKLLLKTKRWSLAAALAIGVALVAASLAKPTEKPTAKQLTAPEFNSEKKEAFLSVWGRGIECKNVIAISVFPKDSASTEPIKNIVPCAASGEFRTEFKLKSESEWKSGLAKIEWTDSKGVSHTMAREIK